MNELKIPSIIVHKGKKEEKYKIYVEDYVVSYLKYQAQRMEGRTIFFYGEKEGQTYLIYGAGRSEQIPEFGKYQLLQEVSWNLTQAGGFFYMEEAGERYRILGYDIFYQTNEEMQSYMIDEKRRNRADTTQKLQKEIESGEETVRNTERKETGEKCVKAAQLVMPKQEKESMPRLISLQLCAIFLLLTAIVIVSMDSYGKMGNLIQSAKEVFFVMENEEKQRDSQVAAGEKTAEEQSETAITDAPEKDEEAAQKTESTQTIESAQTTESERTVESEQTAESEQTTETETTVEADLEPVTEEKQETAQEENDTTQQALSRNVTRYYEVEKGDTLYTISREIYGDISKVQKICELNQIEDPDNISYGQKIILP